MCGFLAEFTFNASQISDKPSFENVLLMSKHRGPDSSEIFSGVNYQLGFNRLAILDLSANGNQPMYSPSKQYHIVFNGEIYNYKELATQFELENLKSSSDTEVLTHLLDKLGVDETIKLLNGMFAIAVKDLKNEVVYLIRDFAGIKPLFYGVCENGIVAASQFDQIFKHTWFKENLELRAEMIKEYFGFGYMQAPNTIYKSVFQVNPGEFIRINSDRTIEKKEYQVFKPKSRSFKKSSTGFEKTLYDKLILAVKRQLVSDVSLASFLSGGIDSPLITAIAKNEDSNMEAFTVSVADKDLDEKDSAIAYAKHINVKHRIEHVNAKVLLNQIDDHFRKLHEPFGDYSSIPTYLITKKARESHTVMLSGDGGDELFFGYPRMLDVVKKEKWFKIPFLIRKPLIRVFNKLKLTNTWAPYHYDQLDEWVKEKHTHIFKNQLDSFFSNKSFSTEMNNLYAIPYNVNLLDWLRYNEFYAHMQRVLIKVDRMSMANSLEVRVPFLDHKIITAAMQYIPGSFGANDHLKSPLRKIMLNFYPKALINKKKKGFTVPLEVWLKNQLKSDVKKVLLEMPFYGGENINLKAVRSYVEDFYNNKHQSAWGIWHLYSWQKWAIINHLI